MITKHEIIELLKEYGGYIDRSRTEKAIHEDNFDIVSDAILSKLHQPTVISSVCIACSGSGKLLISDCDWCKGTGKKQTDL
jgi:hypothetical protein